MPIVEFVPKTPIKPLFAIKLSTVFQRICEYLSESEAEEILKKGLHISENRLIKLKVVEDINGRIGVILIIYNYKLKNGNNIPTASIPQSEGGFFDFKIYELDFNKDVNIEKIIEDENKFFVD